MLGRPHPSERWETSLSRGRPRSKEVCQHAPPRSSHWHDRDRCCCTKIDGRRVMLRRPDGSKVGHGDERGVREAVERLLAERDALVRRASDPTANDVCRDYLIEASGENTVETMD